MSTEAKVGFFVVLGITMLFLLTTQVNEFKNINSEGYRIKAFVKDSTGLEVYSKVKMNGITIGWVESFSMKDEFVVLNLFIKSNVEIPEDSKVTLTKETLLGGRIVSIERGHSSKYLSDGAVLKKYEEYASFEKTSDSFYKTSEEFRQLAHDIRTTLNEDRRRDIENAIQNLSILLKDLKEIIEENRQGVKNIVSNVDKASSRLPEVIASIERTLERYHSVGVTLDKKVPKVMDSIQILIEELNETIAENREPLNRSLNSVNSFFTKGEETIRKLDKIIYSLTDSQLHFGMRGEYNIRDDTFSAYTDIAYLPNPSTYYLLSVISAPEYEYDENGKLKNQLHNKGDILFSIQYGKRYGDWLFRAGLIESTGGLGIDYFALNDKLKLSLEAFDFGAVNDVRNKNANVKLSLRYRIYDHIDLLAGGVNLVNDYPSLFLGIGFHFIDNDLKPFLGSVGGAL